MKSQLTSCLETTWIYGVTRHLIKKDDTLHRIQGKCRFIESRECITVDLCLITQNRRIIASRICIRNSTRFGANIGLEYCSEYENRNIASVRSLYFINSS